MPCHEVAEWYGLNNGRCVNKDIKDPRKGCTSGWTQMHYDKVTDFNKGMVKIYGSST